MKVCFPVERCNGMGSIVHRSLSLAPCYLVVDSETNETMPLLRNDPKIVRRGNNFIALLKEHMVEAFAVGSINAMTLSMYSRSGIKVYQYQHESVKDNVESLRRRELPELVLYDKRRR